MTLATVVLIWAPAHAELRVPASTAYLDLNLQGARVNESGITGWRDPAIDVLWFGQIKTAGKTALAVRLRLVEGASSRLRLTAAGQSREASAQGGGAEPEPPATRQIVPSRSQGKTPTGRNPARLLAPSPLPENLDAMALPTGVRV